MCLQTSPRNSLHTYKLEKDEVENPYLVFYKLFDFARLSQIQNIMWDWLKITVSGGYNKDIYNFHERDRVLHIYEFLEKVVEASHILYLEKKEELSRIS